MVHLGIGDTLLIQCAHFEERHLGVLVGIEPGRLLVVYADLPRAAVKGLRQNPHVSIRYAHESRLHGFAARLLETPERSDSLLFLEYPETTQECDQRSERRLLCNFPARVIGNGHDLPCLVHDLSSSALRVAFEKVDSEKPAFLFTESDELLLQFFVIDPDVCFSFRCRLLREFIASSRRYAVLRLHESERDMREKLRAYVDSVYEGPVRPGGR